MRATAHTLHAHAALVSPSYSRLCETPHRFERPGLPSCARPRSKTCAWPIDGFALDVIGCCGDAPKQPLDAMNTTESEHFEEDELGPGELVVLELPDGSAVMTAVDETEPDGRQYVLSAGAVTGRGRSIAAARGGVWSTPLAASLFVLGAGRELRSPVAGGRVMGLLVQDQVLSPEGGEVLFGDVRCASQRQLLRLSSVGKSSALSTGALAAE
eukprot:ctg_235.g135